MDNAGQEASCSEPEPQKQTSGWLIALIIIAALLVVCCICIVVSALLLGPAMGDVLSTIVETREAATPVP